jgi:hypothetical protein
MKTIMRLPIMRFSLLAVAAGSMILFTGCQQEDLTVNDNENLIFTNETQDRGPGPSANGQGTLTIEDVGLPGQGFRHFTFHAREKNNGSVDGNGVLTYSAGQLKVHFDIDCLNIDGNLANMSGVITKWKAIPENEGLLFWFEVIDNGEGNNADPDQISLFFSGADPVVYDCANNFNVAIYEIEGGNVQVNE